MAANERGGGGGCTPAQLLRWEEERRRRFLGAFFPLSQSFVTAQSGRRIGWVLIATGATETVVQTPFRGRITCGTATMRARTTAARGGSGRGDKARSCRVFARRATTDDARAHTDRRHAVGAAFLREEVEAAVLAIGDLGTTMCDDAVCTSRSTGVGAWWWVVVGVESNGVRRSQQRTAVVGYS